MRPAPPLLLAALGDDRDLSQLGTAQWEELAAAAAEEGLEGLFFQRCASASVPLPPRLARAWQRAYRLTAGANFGALQRLGRLLGEGWVGRVMLLPGAALLPYYPDPGCRPMDDLDLLVGPQESEGFKAWLLAQGFAAVPRYPGLWAGGDLALDLHEDLLNASRIRARRFAGWMDPAEVWRDSRLTCIEGVEVRVMGPEDTALYTAVHALRHSFRRLTWFVDLQLLLRAEIDWTRLADKAQRYNLVRPLAYGLFFLQRQAGCRLPVPAEALLRSISLRSGEALLLRQALRDRRGGEWGDVLWSFSIPQLGRRCRFLAETCFPQPQVLLQVFPYLPAPLYPLAYGLRLLQLLLRGSRQLCGLLAGTQSRVDSVKS